MTYKVPVRDMQFVMNDVLDFPSHYQNLPEGENATPDMVDAILEESAKFAENVLEPLNQTGDLVGCQFDEGEVTTPPGFKEAYHQYVANGWPALAASESIGGQGLPRSLNLITNEALVSSNHAWSLYATVSVGAVETILAHGAEDTLRFLPKLVEGAWAGTMCLTESHSGSDLGLLRTKAKPNGDGSYKISGSKVFISGGEHDHTDNIIHIVLARLPDAPAGVKGISLFIIPKFKVNSDGSLGDKNGVSCGSIEEKMGIHGNVTCVMNFDEAEGYLIGAPHKGMSCMFTFINESRLLVSQHAQGHIEASFQNALAYAQERLQMRAPVRKLKDKSADPIIVHPDVRRMLLTQKAFSEGARMLTYYCAQQVDITHSQGSVEEKHNAETQLALLTPIAKGFISEVSQEATGYGVQILGGHGFICESGQEQHCRDTRITTIYEGTTGIQGLDLLGRKILLSGGEVMQPFVQKIQAFCAQNVGNNLVAQLERSLYKLLELTDVIAGKADKNPDEVNAVGVDYLMFAGYTFMAYFWARAALVAENTINEGSEDIDFYQAKLATAKFYFSKLLPRTATLELTIKAGAEDLMRIDDDAFSF